MPYGGTVRRVAFEEIVEAHRVMEEGRAVGKLVVRVN
jgi:NADPH:quinone reductase-like Zn-dependent oxidoreductase